ncbi:MAG: major capsid protein [Gemmatimonadota bacterium]
MEKEMRFTAAAGNAASPLSDIITRSILETGGWSVEAMRTPGFRMMEAIEQEQMQFRTLAPLMDKAQVSIDKAVVEVGLQRLTLVADMMSAGLVYPLSDPLSVAQLEWSTQSKIGAAQRTMSPQARGENKSPLITPFRLPIYLTTDTFNIDIRTLKTSQRTGMPLDTAIVKQCVRAVNEAVEDAMINGATTLDGQLLQDAGYTAPGLLNHPNVNLKTLTATAWTPATAPVGATVFAEVMSMISILQTDKKFGPYRMYVGTQIGNTMDQDYSTSTNTVTTIRQRLLQIDSLQAIRTADLVPNGNAASPSIGNKVILMQMTSDVADVVMGQAPTVIPWTSLDGMMIHNLVMAIMIPRVRSDADGNSGICVGTTA